jgi:hypothetical protein
MIGQPAKRVSLWRSAASVRLRSVIFHEHVNSADNAVIGVTQRREPDARAVRPLSDGFRSARIRR